MSTSRITLFNSRYLSTVDTIQYTSPTVSGSSARTVIDACVVTNVDTTAADFTIRLVNNGDTESPSNTLILERRLEAGESDNCLELVGQVLLEGQYLSTIASSSASLTARCSGRYIEI